jgi:hypothetical protein
MGRLLRFLFIILAVSCTNKIENKIEITKKSIFDDLFSDISENYYDYINNGNFVARKIDKFPQIGCLVYDFENNEKTIIIENESIGIIYWPDYSNDDIESFFPTYVIIDKKTNDFTLGNFIGDDINIIINEFEEEPIILDPIVSLWYNGNEYTYIYRNDNFYISFRTLENIIINISYHK